MIVAIDIGNSTAGCGVFDNDGLRATWALPIDEAKTASAYAEALAAELKHSGMESNQIREVVICSVVPACTPVIEQSAKDLFDTVPFIVTTDLDGGLTLQYANPRDLGVDRFVAAAKAYALYHTDVIVVDFGTATTFSVVDRHGRYLGGAIAPGIGISADALAERTAQLPRIALLPPRKVIGNDTVSGIQSGILYGHVALVEGMIDRIQRELGRSAKVIGTGGYASLLAPLSSRIDELLPHLTLEGLVWLYLRHRQAQN